MQIMKNKQLSKFLSLILRHKPESVGIKLDKNGWVDIHKLVFGLKKQKGFEETMVWNIEDIVEDDEKNRYSLSIDKQRIRANQGHSIKVDLELESVKPPITLYHGTPNKFLDIINKEGLKKMNRHHVHLSSDLDTAKQVGDRRGKSSTIHIDALEMYNNSVDFYISENGVFLVDYVDPKYFILIKEN